jgi:hypothetical protein
VLATSAALLAVHSAASAQSLSVGDLLGLVDDAFYFAVQGQTTYTAVGPLRAGRKRLIAARGPQPFALCAAIGALPPPKNAALMGTVRHLLNIAKASVPSSTGLCADMRVRRADR